MSLIEWIRDLNVSNIPLMVLVGETSYSCNVCLSFDKFQNALEDHITKNHICVKKEP